MKKRFLLFTIILWIIIALSVVGLMIFSAKGGFNQMESSGTIIKNQEVSLSDVQNIIVDSSEQTVEVKKVSGNSIKISQYGSKNTREDRLFLVSTSGDAVHIYFDTHRNFNFFNFSINEKLVIEIPDSYKGDLDVKTSSGSLKIDDEFVLKDVQLQCSSGSVNVYKNLTADSLNVKTSSGSTNIHGNIIITNSIIVSSSSGSIKLDGTITSKNLNAEASSGSICSSMNITVAEEAVFKCSSGSIILDESLTARELNARTSSGKIRLEDVNVEKYNLKNTSGSINAKSISGGGQAESSSGNIILALKDPKGDVDLSCSSGSIKITLEPSLQFTLDARTTSGGIHTNFETTSNEKNNKATAKIGSNPTVNINAQASSGGIRIER